MVRLVRVLPPVSALDKHWCGRGGTTCTLEACRQNSRGARTRAGQSFDGRKVGRVKVWRGGKVKGGQEAGGRR